MTKCYPQAAEYGKTLLEQNMELEAAKEAAMQEKHELVLKQQAKVGVMMFLMIKIIKMGIMLSLMMKITQAGAYNASQGGDGGRSPGGARGHEGGGQGEGGRGEAQRGEGD